MFIAKINLQQDNSIIDAYIKDNGFATLVSNNHGLMATHLPLTYKKGDGESFLYGHLARPNGQSISVTNKHNVLAIFMNHHSYISSSWYDHVNVPTWNYMAVHIYGIIEPLNREETIASLDELVKKYETGRSHAFDISQMSDKEFEANLRGITPFKITIKEVQASWKMSQNRDDKNHEAIVEKLMNSGNEMDVFIAKEMQRVRREK